MLAANRYQHQFQIEGLSQPNKVILKIHSVKEKADSSPIESLPLEVLVDSWQEEVKFWQEETAFYHAFLKHGLCRVPQELKPELDELIHEFDTYHSAVLPAFANSLEGLKHRSKTGQEVTHAVVGKLHKHRSVLRMLKKRLFGLFPELIPCEIR